MQRIFHSTCHHVQHLKLQEEVEGEDIQTDDNCLPKSLLHVMESAFLWMAEHLSDMGSSE